MKSILYVILISLFFIACDKKEVDNFNEEKYKAELGKYAKDYMMELKGVLVKNMQNGGALAAVNVCSDTAMDLTNHFSSKMGVTVKRFSLKNRNPLNKPDEFEERALNRFEKLIAENKLDKKSYVIEKIEENNETVVKFVKPILIDAPCLNCHGNESQISKEVTNLIKSKYPKDKAINYKIGDLRGAISVTKKI